MRKGVIDKIDNNSTLMQTAKVHGIAGELSDGVERYQEYGFSSYPVAIDVSTGHGSEVILADIGGSSLKTIIATDDRRFRPLDQVEGEVIIYSHIDKTTPHRITLKANGDIELLTGSSSVTLSAGGIININCTTLNVAANTNFTGALTSNGKNISDSHTHGGVQGGSASTAGVN